MDFKKLTYSNHFKELKNRIIKVLIFFVFAVFASYFYVENICQILLLPMKNLLKDHRIIYTDLTEVFFSYLSLALRSAIFLTFPIFNYQLYKFLEPGLYKHEKKIIGIILIISPILFFIGACFVFFLVMPKAWAFFTSFEQNNLLLPIKLEAKISEYIELSSKFIIAFGIAFQLPIILILLVFLNIISRETLKEKRKIAIVFNFIIAAILTPPDVLSQFALAIPLLILYEISIFLSNFINREEKC